MALGRLFGRKKKENDRAGGPQADGPKTGDSGTTDSAKQGRFTRLLKGLARTRKSFASILPFGRKLDEEALEEIERKLIEADFGPATSMQLVDDLRGSFKDKEFDGDQIVPFLKSRLVTRLDENVAIRQAESGPTVILVAGVNGTGKTTSIAKLTHQFHEEGKRVVLGAADTFRAAAVEQLAIWSDRIGVEMVRGKEGGDPSSVVFDALDRGLEVQADVVVIDTAGRLHTEKNLMAQLGKMVRVMEKKIPGAPHEVLQVLDATTGQNAIQQAIEFNKVMTVTGLILTKLDGTARGGVIFPILEQVGLPVKFIGVGEAIEDLQYFDPSSFVDALFA